MLFFTECAKIEQQSPPLTNPQTEATPIDQMSASQFPSLTEQDLKRLDERFPEHQRSVLQNAEQIDVFELADCMHNPTKSGPDDQGLWPINSGKFQNCEVSRHAKVSDAGEKKELVEGILYSISSGYGAACFSPRHGVRAIYNSERIEMLICFECENFEGAPEFRTVTNFAGDRVGPSEKFSGGFSTAVKPLFERILLNASPKSK
jgi:hypothetical protein